MTDPAHPVPFPARPSLERMRRQAGDLQRAHRNADDVATRANVAALLPGPVPDPLPLSSAQLVVARTYGFPSWPRLVAHLAVVAEHLRVYTALADGAHPAAVFLDLACLTYTDDDGPHRWSAARSVLDNHGHLAGIHIAAACADVAAVRRSLAQNASDANALGGPQNWPPLMHVAYARHDPAVTEDATVATVRLLLDHGADANAGFLFEGLPTPFTVLTGVLGGGERNQPPHPHSLALGEVLLAAGADPNDGQALYNRMFSDDDSHLRLLLAHGLGAGDGGPWHRRMPDATDPPEVMLREQLLWASTHGYLGRIRLLAEHGVELSGPLLNGRTPTEMATRAGHPEVVELLVELGASPPDLSTVEALVGAALAADEADVERIRERHPTAPARMRERHPGLIVRAAAAHNPAAIRLLVRLGFDVDALARADLPVDQPWEAALHVAAGAGDEQMVRELLALGADPGVRDGRFDATPADWARYSEHEVVAEVLDAAMSATS